MSDHADPEYASARVRMTATERRSAILSAARREFARAGFHGASTASIARLAGCSEPMLYKHFASKHALFGAVLEEVALGVEAAFDRVLEQPGSFVEHLLRFLPIAMHDPNYVESMQLRKLAVTVVDAPEVRATLVAMQERHVERTRAAVLRAISEGQAPEGLDPEHVAWTWTGLMFAACYREALTPGGFAQMLPVATAYVESLRTP